jgi:hypothetical protein
MSADYEVPLTTALDAYRAAKAEDKLQIVK